MDINLADYLIDYKRQYSSVLIDVLNSTDKDSLNKYLIYSIDYNNRNLPFKIDKYFGHLDYILNDDDDGFLPKEYKFHVIVTDYQFKISIFFEVLIFKIQPIVILDNLFLDYEIPVSKIENSKDEIIVAKINLSKLNLKIHTNELTYEIIFNENSCKFNIDFNTGLLMTDANKLYMEGFYFMKLRVQNAKSSNQNVYLLIDVMIKIINDKFEIIEDKFFLNSNQYEEFLFFKNRNLNINSKIIYQEYENLFEINKFENKIFCKECKNSHYNLIVLLTSPFNESKIVYLEFLKNKTSIDKTQENQIVEFNTTWLQEYTEIKNIELNIKENLPLGSLIIDLNSMRNYTNVLQTIYKLNDTNNQLKDKSLYFYFQNGQLILKRKFDFELHSEIYFQVLCLSLIKLKNNQHLNLNVVYNIKLNIIKFNNQRPQFAYIRYSYNLNINDLMLNQTEKYFIDHIKAYNKYTQSSILYYLQSYDEINDDSSNNYIQKSGRSVSMQQNSNGKFFIYFFKYYNYLLNLIIRFR